jgi:hypothetical protein
MTPRWALPVVLALLLTAGCASFALGAADRSALRSATLVEACPLGLAWTRVSVSNTNTGAELTFTTTSSRVEEVRRRVRDQASASGPNRHVGQGHDGEHGGTRDHGLRLWAMGKLKTSVEDTPSGAKLAVEPVDASRRAELQHLLARRVAHLDAADCPD